MAARSMMSMVPTVLDSARQFLVKVLTRDASRYITLHDGIRVPRQLYNENIAMTISAVWSAVTLVAGHLSSVPLNVYRRLPGGGREKARDLPLWRALHDEPYPGMSSVEYREALVANIELHGVGYSGITVRRDELRLLPFNTLHVTPDPLELVYRVSDGKKPPFTVPRDSMIVFPALSFDGMNPVHVPALRKRTLSLAISYEERAEAFNRNGATPSGVAIWGDGYGKMTTDDRARLEKKWEDLYRGVSNSGGTVFLPEGSDFKPIQFDPEALQMLASRQHSVTEIARWFRVPPHKLGDLSRATFSNIEHQAIEYIQDSMLPRAAKIESIFTMALIPAEKRDEYFIEFNLDGLQRGDFKSRMEGYSIGRNIGVFSPNDIARMENLNPISPDDGGDTYLVPLNMVPSGPRQALPRPADENSPGGAPAEGEEKIQDTALNGAQVKALVGILAEVVAGRLTKDTAKELIQVAFPLIETAKIDAMLKDIKEGSDPEAAVRSATTENRTAASTEYLRRRAAATVRRNITDAYAPAFQRSAASLIKTEVDQVRAAATEKLPDDLPGFLQFLDDFYSDTTFLPQIRDGVRAVIADYAGQIEVAALEEIGLEPTEGALDDSIARYVENYAVRHLSESRGQLGKLAEEATADEERDPAAEVATRLDSWEENRAAAFARDEPVRAEGAFSRAAWMLAGVTSLMWVTYNKSCPSCSALDGRIVSVTQNFVTKGETVGVGTPAQVTVNTNIGHPQLHSGCDCGLAAVIG